MEACNGFGNTGFYQNCDSNFKVMRGLFVVPTYDGDGVKNKIAAGTAIDAAYLTARLNDADKTKRWYPIMQLENTTEERGDPTLFTNPSGAVEFVKDGVKTFASELRRRGAEFKGQIESCECNELSFFAIDIDGRLRGLIETVEDGSPDFFPIPIQPGSFYSKLAGATEENPEHITFSFQYELTVKDSLLRIYPTSLTTADLLNAKGLYDVYSTISDIAVTGFKADLRTLYTDGDKYRPTGLVAGDFALYNVTDAGAVVITSATETEPGVYTFVFAGQTVADVLRLTPTKNGFDFTAVVENTIIVEA
jgi:hypothetical protein